MSCRHNKSYMNKLKLNSFLMLSIYKTSFKEKSDSLIRAATLGDRWMSVITILLVYRKDLRSENKMSSLKARSFWQSVD